MKPKSILTKDINNLSRVIDSAVDLYIHMFESLPSVKYFATNKSIKDIQKYLEDRSFTVLNVAHSKYGLRYIMLISEHHHTLIGLMYQIYDKQCSITVAYDYGREPTELTEFFESIKVVTEDPNYINFIINGYDGLDLHKHEYTKKEISIEDNYDVDFYPTHEKIKEFLNSKRSGIHILYGDPGTGKSSYIKHLINAIDKKFIYCPSSMVSELAGPGIIKLMIEQGSNCIFIIEDAEEALIDRGSERNSAVTNLLNLSDGVLGDSLNIQIIATFNTNFKDIDPAMLRKGRLLSKYEFTKLSVKKSQELLNKLKIDAIATEPMSLAEIYNYNQEEYGKEERRIGL